jgi:hypothetical protein
VPKLPDAILFIALVALLIVLPHYLIRKVSRKYGPKVVRSVMNRSFRPILTIYFRRKVTRQIQDERKANGLPPLENPHVH